MEKNTLNYLNSKIWYRFLKLVYVFIFLIAIGGITTAMVIDERPHEVIDDSSTIISCNNGSVYPYKGNKFSYETIRLCGGSFETKNTPNDISRLPEKNYEIKFVYKIQGSWKSVVKFELLILVIACSLFEAIRRSFYYVILGTFRPKKA